MEEMKAGRTCPIDYRIEENAFERVRHEEAAVYIIGGLYGNITALKQIKKMAREEEERTSIRPTLIFNGDYHWFDADIRLFEEVEALTAGDIRLLGNVEKELSRKTDMGAGCGCAYPPSTDDAAVERSNQIHKRLKGMLRERDDLKEAFAQREPIDVVRVGEAKIGVTHGDERSLAGWGFSGESMEKAERQEEIRDFMEAYEIDCMATTHTCAQAVFDMGNRLVLNNGSAGMSSLAGKSSGIFTRIALTPSPDVLYSKKIKGVYMELLEVAFDKEEYIKVFDSVWEKGSPAEVSYRERLYRGVECPFVLFSK